MRKPAWIRASSSLLRANLVNFGAASLARNLHCGLFLGGVAGLPRRRSWLGDVAAERIELAVGRGAPDTQPPRDLGHAAAIMRDGESDGLAFDIFERSPSQQPARVRWRKRGRKEGLCVRRSRPRSEARSDCSRPHAREGACPRTAFRAAAGAARRSMRSTNLTISIPINSVLARPVAIAQSSNDSGTVWNAVCRNGT
jgi:hypothetical protein